MALAVLDGNQTATTLSSVVTGGEHIVAHSVVSLGSAAISNITSAVSGSVVSISNFPASQSTTFGAVTGSVSVLNFPSTQTIAGTVTANVNLISDQAGGNSPVVFGVPGADVNTIRTVIYSSANSSFGNDQGAPVDSENPLPITGTVTANVFGYSDNEASYQPIPVVPWDESVNTGRAVVVKVQQEGVGPLPISGTVTANAGTELGTLGNTHGFIALAVDDNGTATPLVLDGDGNLVVKTSGTVTVGALNVWDAGNDEYSAVRGFSVGSFGSAMQVIGGDEINLINGRPSLPVAGTVTVSTLPSGALTTRFGSVTTANTAQITSAVTNTSRKYLLAQNISAGTVTIGIGFSPTTTQGIQLPAGGGLTFDAFCPTGAVYWLGAVTGAAFTILEG